MSVPQVDKWPGTDDGQQKTLWNQEEIEQRLTALNVEIRSNGVKIGHLQTRTFKGMAIFLSTMSARSIRCQSVLWRIWCSIRSMWTLLYSHLWIRRRWGATATMTPLEVKTATRYLVCSVLFPCPFYKLTLEGAIVTEFLQWAHSVKSGCVKKNTKLGGRKETRHTPSGRGRKLYIFKCKNQTDKIFVNIKFLVCFSFFFFEWMNEMLILWRKRQQVQFANTWPPAWCFTYIVEFKMFMKLRNDLFLSFDLFSCCPLSDGLTVASRFLTRKQSL